MFWPTREMREQGTVLRDVADPALVGRDPRAAAHDRRADADQAGIRRFEPRDEAEDGGLATAGRTDDRHRSPVRDDEVEGLEGLDVAERLRNPLEDDLSHA